MEIDVVATVVSPNAVRAPIAGEKAAIVYVEGYAGDVLVGAAVLGDLLKLRFDGGEIELVVRRAIFVFVSSFDPPKPFADPLAPELVPLLQRGATGVRERLVRSGDRLRVRGVVEAYRSLGAARFVARDDVSAIRLDEVLSFEP